MITGAASGIGRALAERCVSADVKVTLADIDEENLAKAETELKTAGGTVLAVRTDVSKRIDVERLARRATHLAGCTSCSTTPGSLPAGRRGKRPGTIWAWVIGVNLWGVIHGVKVFTPLMLTQNTECHIVNTSSGAGLIVGGGSAPYSVTKHAVVALSESLSPALQQQKPAVGVSVLCPGLVRTDIINTERHRPAELRNEPIAMTPQMPAGLAVFKASLNASMPPSQVADLVFEAIHKEQFYILSHPEWTEVIQLRTDRLLRMETRRTLRQPF